MWQSILIGMSAATVILAAAGRYIKSLTKLVRTITGLIVTVKELAEAFHAHTEHHHKHDPKETETLNDVVKRLERLEAEWKDVRSMLPHLRKHVPSQESHTG